MAKSATVDAMKRASMRTIREVLRLRHEALSHRAISAATGIAKGTVFEYLRRAAEAGMTWETSRALDDAELESVLFNGHRSSPATRVPINHELVHRQLSGVGVTLQLLWVEYRDECVHDPEGRRPQFGWRA